MRCAPFKRTSYRCMRPAGARPARPSCYLGHRVQRKIWVCIPVGRARYRQVRRGPVCVGLSPDIHRLNLGLPSAAAPRGGGRPETALALFDAICPMATTPYRLASGPCGNMRTAPVRPGPWCEGTLQESQGVAEAARGFGQVSAAPAAGTSGLGISCVNTAGVHVGNLGRRIDGKVDPGRLEATRSIGGPARLCSTLPPPI